MRLGPLGDDAIIPCLEKDKFGEVNISPLVKNYIMSEALRK